MVSRHVHGCPSLSWPKRKPPHLLEDENKGPSQPPYWFSGLEKDTKPPWDSFFKTVFKRQDSHSLYILLADGETTQEAAFR